MTLEELEARCASRQAIGDLPSSMTRAEVTAYMTESATIERHLMQARNAIQALATLSSADSDHTWLSHLESWRKVLCDELLEIKSPIRDPATRGKSINLTCSIRCIDFGPDRALRDQPYSLPTLRLGALMIESGYQIVGADPQRNYGGDLAWLGSIKEVEARMADRERRRSLAQAQLDTALLDDDIRSKQDAESKAQIEALNALPQRKTRGDGSQYDKFPDGRRVEVEPAG